MRQVEQLEGRRERRPRNRLVENANYAVDECNIVESLLSKPSEPKSLSAAMNSDASTQWKGALKSEMDSLSKNKTWEFVPRPDNVNIVGK